MDIPGPGLRTRELAAAGVTDHERRGRAWQQVSHGVHAPHGSCADLLALAAATALALPADAAYGHLTGAALRGWPLPTLPAGTPLIAASTSMTHVQRAGSYVRRVRRLEATNVNGVRVQVPLDVLLDCAQDLALIDLVALTDGACRLEGLEPTDLAGALPHRRRGAAALRRALVLAEPLSESWFESVLRLVHVLSGITAIEAQAPIRNGGGVVARADLRLVGTSRLVEYDGADHRRRDQHHADLRREKLLDRLGYDRYGYVEPEIARLPGQIVRDAEDALGLPHRPTRVRGWWRHAHEATVTARGRRRLERRLERFGTASQRPDRPRQR